MSADTDMVKLKACPLCSNGFHAPPDTRAALQSLGYAEMERANARLREALACSQEHIRKMLRARLASKTKHRAALRRDREQGEG
jgi:hypothetical protein